MDDLISRQAAIDALKRSEALVRAFGFHNAIEAIQEVPAADVAPVRHGRWETEIITDAYGLKHACYACSVCGVANDDDEFDFCPNCGAKMEVEHE